MRAAARSGDTSSILVCECSASIALSQADQSVSSMDGTVAAVQMEVAIDETCGGLGMFCFSLRLEFNQMVVVAIQKLHCTSLLTPTQTQHHPNIHHTTPHHTTPEHTTPHHITPHHHSVQVVVATLVFANGLLFLMSAVGTRRRRRLQRTQSEVGYYRRVVRRQHIYRLLMTAQASTASWVLCWRLRARRWLSLLKRHDSFARVFTSPIASDPNHITPHHHSVQVVVATLVFANGLLFLMSAVGTRRRRRLQRTQSEVGYYRRVVRRQHIYRLLMTAQASTASWVLCWRLRARRWLSLLKRHDSFARVFTSPIASDPKHIPTPSMAAMELAIAVNMTFLLSTLVNSSGECNAKQFCSNSCVDTFGASLFHNGVCEDGGPNSVSFGELVDPCILGSDCGDCGLRWGQLLNFLLAACSTAAAITPITLLVQAILSVNRRVASFAVRVDGLTERRVMSLSSQYLEYL